jgi:hypothetical protein
MRLLHLHAPRQMACLACGETRVVSGHETGECPRCHYVGWAYTDDLDGSTVRMIMNGVLARDHRQQALRPAR